MHLNEFTKDYLWYLWMNVMHTCIYYPGIPGWSYDLVRFVDLRRIELANMEATVESVGDVGRGFNDCGY